jgi:hypothetical protein
MLVSHTKALHAVAGALQTNASNPTLPGGLRVMDPGNYPPVTSFPSFTGAKLESLGFLTWQSRMVVGEWGTNITSGPPGRNAPLGTLTLTLMPTLNRNEPLITGRGLQGLSTNGPVVLYDEESLKPDT